VRELESEVK